METQIDIEPATEPQPAVTPHPDIKPPTPDEIDAQIAFFEQAKTELAQAKERFDEQKADLVFLVDNFGHRPSHAEQSLRILGRRHTCTVTRGTMLNVNEAAVANLKSYLGELGSSIFGMLFAQTIKHTLIEGAADVLKRLQLPRRTEEKVMSLFGRCIEPKPKAPSVTVELIKPEKPAKKPRGKKAA